MFDTPASGTARIGVTRQISVDGGIPPFCGEVNGHCGDGIGEACLYYNSKMEGCPHVVRREERFCHSVGGRPDGCAGL